MELPEDFQSREEVEVFLDKFVILQSGTPPLKPDFTQIEEAVEKVSSDQ